MRLIDADALEREYQEQYKLFTWDDGEREKATLARVIQMLHAQPTIEERKKGKWICVSDGLFEIVKCDQCGFVTYAIEGHMGQYNFCPNCGARMVVKHE